MSSVPVNSILSDLKVMFPQYDDAFLLDSLHHFSILH